MKYNVRAMLWSLSAVCLWCPSQGAMARDQQVPATGKPACPATLNGLYGFVASGFVPARQANGAFHQTSIEELGLITYRSDGTASLRVNVVMNGKVANKSFSGTYSIDVQSCLGKVQWQDGPGWGFAVVGSGSELNIMDVRGGESEVPVAALVFVAKKT